MKIFPPVLLLLFLMTVPALGQTSYSFDNFDTRKGVQVVVSRPVLRLPNSKAGRMSKSVARKAASNPTGNPAATNSVAVTPLVQNIVLTLPPVSTLSVANASALRGYTTGNAQVDTLLIQSGTSNGVDPLLLYSVMHQESSFKPRAISPKGASGLMQLMPGTARRYGVTNIFDPKQNIEGGARYLRFLLDHFEDNLNLALAGYNAGEGAVEKYGWRIPPYAETQEYVRRISRRYALLRDPNAALYAPSLTKAQVARLQITPSIPLALYERTVSTVRLPDGRLQLMSQ